MPSTPKGTLPLIKHIFFESGQYCISHSDGMNGSSSIITEILSPRSNLTGSSAIAVEATKQIKIITNNWIFLAANLK